MNMGNEMGNSNTSGLRAEEENTTTQVPENSVQEADSAEVENHNAPLAEIKDHREKDNGVATDVPNGAANPQVAIHTSHEREEKESEVQPPAESPEEHEKLPGNTDGAEGENYVVPVGEGEGEGEKEINGLSSDVPKEAGDPHIVNHISDEREQEETKVHSPAEPPNSEVESIDAGNETGDIQPTSPSNHLEVQEIPQESNLEENLPQISDNQLEKQASIKKEEAGIYISNSETISLSHDPEPPKFEDLKFDQPELAKIHDDLPIQHSNESTHIHENGHAIGAMISKDLDGTVVSGSNPEVDMKKDDSAVKETTSEEASFEYRLEIKDGDEIGNDFGVGIKWNEEIPTEKSPINTYSPEAESEVISTDESLNPHIEVFESTDNCAAETTWTEKESENGENKPGGYTTQSGKESVKESKADGENVSQSELLMIEDEGENNQKRIEDFTCCGGNKDYIEEAKIAKNGHLVDGHIDDQNEASVESCKYSQKEAEMVHESGIVLTDTDCEREEVSEERQIIGEIEEKSNASYAIENDTEGRESGEQCLSAVEQEVSLLKAPLSHVQPQDNQQNNDMQSKNIQSSNDSIPELKPESKGDFLVTEASCFYSKKLMAETSVSVAELAIEEPEQDHSQLTAKTMMVATEANIQVNNVSEQCAKVEMPDFASDDYQVQEIVGRLSTESNSNNPNTHAQMQKSPSFGLDLRIEARTEESAKTPLLCQDKTATEDFSGEQEVTLSSPIAHTHYDQDKLQHQAMPVVEKVVRMERNDSEKLKTPFLGFLKEEEEAQIIVTPQKHDNINAAAKKANKESLNLHNKEVTATSKVKRKPRSSLFTTCMCCTTVIN